MTRKRVLTGDTPTGKLHIGHYVGTLENRVKLQDEYETFIINADTHALSTLAQTPQIVRQHTYDVLADNLAAGLNPDKVSFYLESAIPEIYELSAIFSMYVSHNRALRNPTVKDEIKMKGMGDKFSLGFVNYPIFQAADILCVKAHLVPVGQDQVAHLEQSREIARDINAVAGREIFPVPEAKVGRVGKLVGTDGNPKMSKSLGNTIFLSESREGIKEKVMNMYTDPKRVHATDPGTIKGNPLFEYLDTFATDGDKDAIADFKERYQKGMVGDVEVKEYLVGVMERLIAPMRERRAQYEDKPELLKEILSAGTARSREIVVDTLDELRECLALAL